MRDRAIHIRLARRERLVSRVHPAACAGILAVLATTLPSCAQPPRGAAPTAAAASTQPITIVREDPPTTPPPVEILPRTSSHPERVARPAALRLLQRGRYTLDVQGAELRTLLAGIVRDSPFSLVVGPEVTGTVTADLEDVSLYTILEQVVVPRGYRYAVSGNLITVGASPVETRTYQIDYPSYQRDGRSELSVFGAIATDASVGEGDSAGGDTSASTIVTGLEQDFWGEIAESLQAILDADGESAGPSQVLVAPQSGLVLVRATAERLDEVEAFLFEMMAATRKQVLIDTRIIEVTLSDDFELGVDLEVAPTIPASSDATGAAGRLIDPSRRNAVVRTNLSVTPTNGGFVFGVASNRISAQLRTLAAQTDVRVISTPRVATMNNHKALIKVVRNQVFFIAETDVQIVEGVGTTTTTEFVPQIVPIGVTLDVTPRISQSQEITLHIHPSVSEVVAVQAQPSATPGLTGTGSLPVVDLRETDTVVRVDDGETIVIGGLMRTRELDVERKVPILGDLPLLGGLFRATEVDELRTELVILLTPTIMDPPRVRKVALDSVESLEALDTLREERRPRPRYWREPTGRAYGDP